jgi:hypothetical protein
MFKIFILKNHSYLRNKQTKKSLPEFNPEDFSVLKYL